MEPVWRLIFDLRHQGRPDDDGTGDHNDEYCGPIARVGEAEIQTAPITAWLERSGIRRTTFLCRIAGNDTTAPPSTATAKLPGFSFPGLSF